MPASPGSQGTSSMQACFREAFNVFALILAMSRLNSENENPRGSIVLHSMFSGGVEAKVELRHGVSSCMNQTRDRNPISL